ncbi:MAG: 3-methyl-2-oxobutanoate hydroxymethyltransferase [Gammaproteobacteria bacterium]|nr:3-methyl-2-oxobutanoate hydroxymethyltransferase [Gammaproteobacteria bacterium]
MSKTVTVATLKEMKKQGEKIACLTAYDYSFASLIDDAGMDLIMVGDSLGMVMQGYDSTIPVTLEDMAYHSRCVANGVMRALLVVDLPFMSYQIDREQALESAGMLMKEGDAQMVKLEGGAPMVETVHFLVERGVPVCAHLGLTPQSVHQLGGYRVQGKEADSAQRILDDARSLEQAGAGALVLEAVPASLAKEITNALTIPTIGIGAGVDCDGQILVLQDMLGIYPRPSPKFSKNFMQGCDSIGQAIKNYIGAVKQKTFPAAEHSF